jgi:hypothetical protein
MPSRRWSLFGGLAFLATVASCAPGGGQINCTVVRLHRQQGQSVTEIAAGLGAAESDVAKCGEAPITPAETGADQTPSDEGAPEAAPSAEP